MDDIGFFLIVILFLTGLGLLFALPVLFPPVRRWLRGSREWRITAVLGYSFFIFLLLFITLSQLSAQIQVVFFCLPQGDTFENGFSDGKQRAKQTRFVTCSDDEAIELGYANAAALKTALTAEFFQRIATPPPFRQACYHPNLAFCNYVENVPIQENSFWLGLLPYLWTSMVTGLLIWQWSKPKGAEVVGGEL